MVKYSADKVFAALGHPVRRSMVERLAQSGKLSLSELAQPFPMSLPAVMKHADLLEKYNIVVSLKEGRVRYYAINTKSLIAGLSWFRGVEKIWEDRFDRLEEALQADTKNT